MSVEQTNALYNSMLSVWNEMDDVCMGERQVKAMRERYLPMINACDDTQENIAYYDAYLKRAVFYPIAKDTLQNNVGLAFSEDPSFEPDGMDFLKSDADGAGNSLYQLNQTALNHLLKYRRGGYLVDHPVNEGGASRSDVANGIRPTVVLYSPKSIINWRVKKINGTYKTSLVVLLEKSTQVDPHDEFNEVEVKNYRVLRLDEDNKYCVQVYSDASGKLEASDVYYPTNSKGSKWGFIPFQPIGAQVNDFNIDEIPLEPIASVNLAHYRNSAEYEQSVFYTSQVQPVITELDEAWRDWLKENGMVLGSATPLMLPSGADFKYVQTNESNSAKDGMTDKLNYMQLLGSKVTEANQVAKTATQSDNEQMTKHSVLSLCVSNLNEAMESVLFWCSEYFGSGDKAKFTIKQDFAKGKIGLEELKFWQSEMVAENISKETFYYIKKNGKLPEIDFEGEQARIESEKVNRTV